MTRRDLVALGAIVAVAACGGESFSSSPAGGDGGSSSDAAAGSDAGTSDGGTSGDASTPCTDTTSDPHNCGRCGHDCLGGACTASKCGAVDLATSLTVPMEVAVAGSTLYFADRDKPAIYKCPVSGCPSGVRPYVEQPTLHYAGGIAVDAADFWFTDEVPGGHVYRDPSTGVIDVKDWPGISRIVLTQNAVYGIIDGTGANPVQRLARDTTVISYADTSGNERVWALAATTDTLFWARNTSGAIAGCPLATCGTLDAAIVLSAPQIWGLTAKNGRLFFTNDTTGRVSSCEATLTGCGANGVQSIGQGTAPAHDVIADATTVYWVGGAGIYRCPIAGCAGTPDLLVAEPAGVVAGIAVDDVAVYYAAPSRHAVSRVAK